MNEADLELLEALDLPAELAAQPVESDLELTDEERRFREERRTMLGGTDAAAVLGFSTYRNEWDVAAEKKGILPPWGGNERTELGQVLEDPVARIYAKRTGQRLRKVGAAVRDKIHPFFGVHPDRYIIGKKKGLEVKTVEYGKEKWSEPGQPVRVPRDYYVQVQTYMMVTGFSSWDLCALFGLSRVRWYTITRNEVVIGALREKLAPWWQRFVLTEEMPAIGPSDRAKAWLRERYPEQKNDTLVIANPEQAALVRRWIRVKDHVAKVEKQRDALKMQVQSIIGDATGIIAGDVSVTWKKNKDSTALVTDYVGLLAHLAEKHGFQVEAQDLARFTQSVITREGARMMRVGKAK